MKRVASIRHARKLKVLARLQKLTGDLFSRLDSDRRDVTRWSLEDGDALIGEGMDGWK